MPRTGSRISSPRTNRRKRRYHVAGIGGARGYTPFGVETAKGATHHDLKEFWQIGRELPPGHRYRASMPDNVWIEGDPGFRKAALELWDSFDRMGRKLLEAIAVYLELDRHWFDDKVGEGNSVLRVIHYPPLAAGATGVRAGAHEDINVITLLLGAEEGGLELLDRNGRWLPVNPPPGTLVCNVGDMLQRLTNHVLPSTTHRVVNPTGERARRPRYSMPFFLHFNSDSRSRRCRAASARTARTATRNRSSPTTTCASACARSSCSTKWRSSISITRR